MDLLVTTNQGPGAALSKRRRERKPFAALAPDRTNLRIATASAQWCVYTPDGAQMRTVKSGSSYLSQSELAVTFGLGPRDSAERVVVEWPSGRTQEFRHVRSGRYSLTENQPLR